MDSPLSSDHWMYPPPRSIPIAQAGKVVGRGAEVCPGSHSQYLLSGKEATGTDYLPQLLRVSPSWCLEGDTKPSGHQCPVSRAGQATPTSHSQSCLVSPK